MSSKPIAILVGNHPALSQGLTGLMGEMACDLMHFQEGRLALEHLRSSPASFMCVFPKLDDMHWLTFLRVLRSDEHAFFLPVLLLLEDDANLERKERELLESYEVDVTLPSSADKAALKDAIGKMISGQRRRAQIEGRLAEAKRLYRQGLLAAAKGIYDEMLKDNEQSLVARSGLIYAGKQDQEESMRQLRYVLEADPENYNYKFELLQHYVSSNDMVRFKKLFDAIMAELATSTEAYWLAQLGEVCLSLKLASFCEKIVEVMLRSPESVKGWEPYLFKARTVLAMGAIQEAQTWVARAEAYGGADRPETLNLRGIIKRKQGEDKDALALFEKAALLAQDDHRLAFNIALCYRNLRQEAKAVASLRRAITLCPTYKRAHELLERMQAN